MNKPRKTDSVPVLPPFESRDKENYSARFAAALRKQFGGHDVVTHDLTTKTEPQQRTLHTDGSADAETNQ